MTMRALAVVAKGYPRVSAGIAFGVLAMALTHFAWYPAERQSHISLSIGAGAAYALAGILTAPRLFDPARTRTGSQASFVGVITGLLATAFFGVAMTAVVTASDAGPHSVPKFVATFFYTSVFAFLGAGWALMILSVALAWALFRVAEQHDR